MENFDLIIVGGGLAGASLAVALRRAPLRIALVESAAPRRPANAGWDARVYAVSPANAKFLAEIGVWKHLDPERMASIQKMAVSGDHGGRLCFSAYETGVDELGWIMESSLMACELWENVKRQSNLTLFTPSRPQAITLGNLDNSNELASLTLDTGETLQAKLIVAADGRDSWLRQQVGLVANNTHYGEKGVVANFTTQLPHRQIAHQWFRDDGVLAYLPLPGQRMSMVWSAPDALADELCALPAAELAARVAAAGQHVLGELDVITPAVGFPLRLMQVPHIVAPRFALVGDAGHGIHPLSGHGINLGFQDAAALAERLLAVTTGQKTGQDIGELRFLQGYQRARKEETWLLQNTTHALRRLFRDNPPGLKTLRNLGLNLTDRLPLGKNILVRYALGAF